jgi:pilus assembly protein CpaC
MTFKALLRACALAAVVATSAAQAPAALAQSGTTLQNAQDGLAIGVGKGTLVRLPRPVSDVFVANNKIADVQVRSATQIYVFGVGGGETSLYATDGAGKVVYSATIRVAQNIDQIKSMLGMTMPGAAIEVTPMNGMVLLTGTVAGPGEVEEATRLVTAFVGAGTTVVNKLKTAMPVQVNLRVKFAEISRDVLKEIGANLATRDTTGSFLFGLGRGRDAVNLATGSLNVSERGTTLGLVKRLAGVDIGLAFDLLESDGVISVLAEPNLTALSGETASFLAGGEFPIPTTDGQGAVNVEFKEYGVGLAFTPTVLDDNRISMRVRPEVSELTEAGAVRVSNFTIPALATRRAETTVELGSGQSFMIAGLLRNRASTSADRTPFLGNLPVLGALFKSDRYQRNETELVIIITPYLVKPVSADRIHLPTDGHRTPSDAERILLGKTFEGTSGAKPPRPRAAPTNADGRAPAPAATPAPGFELN